MDVPTKVANKKAYWAYKQVNEYVQKATKEQKKNFRSYVKRLPSLMQDNGMANAIAFVFSKRKSDDRFDAWNYLYNILLEWLRDYYKMVFVKDNDLMKTVLELNSFEYKFVYDELISILNWLRRFAEGLIADEEKS